MDGSVFYRIPIKIIFSKKLSENVKDGGEGGEKKRTTEEVNCT